MLRTFAGTPTRQPRTQAALCAEGRVPRPDAAEARSFLVGLGFCPVPPG